MELGEPDESGRRRPIPKLGSEFVMDLDTVIVALGTTPNPLIPQSTSDIKTGRGGVIIADPETGRTTMTGVWAGGDAVTGAATVISAMGAGKRAAADMHAKLTEKSAQKSAAKSGTKGS
jgi:glutamate synthase (NADPH/NADH) small chain